MQTYTDHRVIILTEPEAEEARNVLARAIVRTERVLDDASPSDQAGLRAERTALHELAIACGL